MKTSFLGLLLLYSCATAAQPKIKWPDHKQAVIVLTYDDGLNSQANHALPQLEAARLKATFFLTGYMGTEDIAKWRKAASRGFELANHTIFHPCCRSENNPVASENYTLESMIREIDVMNTFLYAIDNQQIRTFAYPCMDTLAGSQSYVNALRDAELVRYARLGGDSDAIITNCLHLDLMRVPAYAVEEHTSGMKLTAFIKRVEQKGGMGIFVFHGIGGDYISTSAHAHQELLRYLKVRKKQIWVTTFRRAMDFVAAWQLKMEQTELRRHPNSFLKTHR
jgi:peptidoglycan/xylan/chitin deacetylase (PgdA/CDA1 family)